MSQSFNNRSLWMAAFGLAVLTLTGCASKTRVEPPAPVESRLTGAGAGGAGSGAAGSGASTGAVTPGAPIEVRNGADAGGGTLGRVVYFDFDSFSIKDEFRGTVEGQARRLSGDRKRRMIIEGHTDERGGREYNLALGQKRAEAVLKSLTLLGVQDSQLEAVSFGKERPAAQGSDEGAWAKNRRAELKDR